MAMKSIIERRIRQIVHGGPGWVGAVSYARSITNGPPNAPAGAPPGMRDEVGPSKPTSLNQGIRGKIKKEGRQVVGLVYSVAHRKGVSYPMILEKGWGNVHPHPWLAPTGRQAMKKADSIISQDWSAKENKELDNFVSKAIGKKDITVYL